MESGRRRRTRAPRSSAAQVMEDNIIALFELTLRDDEMKVVEKRHYRLVPADRLVLLVNGLGNPMNSRGLGRAFAAWCAKAGLPENCRAHGLRKAGARRLAEAGATEHQIMSFLGHANPAMAARYTAAANRGTMAAAGLAKLRTVAGTDLSNPD